MLSMAEMNMRIGMNMMPGMMPGSMTPTSVQPPSGQGGTKAKGEKRGKGQSEGGRKKKAKEQSSAEGHETPAGTPAPTGGRARGKKAKAATADATPAAQQNTTGMLLCILLRCDRSFAIDFPFLGTQINIDFVFGNYKN